jgi:RHS repeat-associated protein
VPNGIGYTGHVNDPDTGLIYMQQRYYEPLAGRFLSVDPVTTDANTGANTGASFNRYAYALNSPYTYKDPDGRVSQEVVDFSAGLGDVLLSMVSLGLWDGPEIRSVLMNDAGNVDTSSSAYESGFMTGVVATVGLGGVASRTSPQTTSTATVSRYMGPDEAATATSTGSTPNVNRTGQPRPTHVTTDPPMNSASAAQTRYELPSPPTHVATVPASRVRDLGPTPDGRQKTSGGGSQNATNQHIPVKRSEIRELIK